MPMAWDQRVEREGPTPMAQDQEENGDRGTNANGIWSQIKTEEPVLTSFVALHW